MLSTIRDILHPLNALELVNVIGVGRGAKWFFMKTPSNEAVNEAE